MVRPRVCCRALCVVVGLPWKRMVIARLRESAGVGAPYEQPHTRQALMSVTAYDGWLLQLLLLLTLQRTGQGWQR